MYKIAVCDDNEEYLSEFKEVICKVPEYNPDIMELYAFRSGEEFLKEKLEEFQLVFLDMQMGDLDGYETAKYIRRQNEGAVLAFCSGVVSPLPEHFNVQPYRYFMKQSDLEQTQKVIGELLIEMIRRHNSEIEVVSDGRAMRITNDQIMYIERRKRGSELFIQENLMDGTRKYFEVISSESLEEWYAQLREEGFEYVHKSFLVNMKQIVAVVKNTVIFPNGEQICITKTYRSKFIERFSHYFNKKFRRNL